MATLVSHKRPQPQITSVEPDSPLQAPSHQRTYPEWFNRVRGINYLDAQDYDEDISDLGDNDDEDDNTTVADCECEEGNCACPVDVDEDYYYQCRDDRERRKLELVELRREREVYMSEVKAGEREVQTAYQAFLERGGQMGTGKVLSPTIISHGDFTLYSSDHLSTLKLGSDDGGRARVYFYPFEDELVAGMVQSAPQPPPQGAGTVICGGVYFTSEANCDFGPFTLPALATVAVLEPRCENHIVQFQFFSDRYLKMRVSRNLFSKEDESVASLSDMVDCFGILRDKEKDKRKRKEREEGRKQYPALRF